MSNWDERKLMSCNFPLWNLYTRRNVTIIVLFNAKAMVMIIRSKILQLALLFMFIPGMFAFGQSRVSVETIPLVKKLIPGQVFEIAVVFTMEPEWHIYWQNPGDAGIPTTFTWTLPPLFSMVDMQEPVPDRHVDEGITTFIHEEEAIYLFQCLAPADIPDTSVFEVAVDWLECKSICQAGADTLQFSLPQHAKTEQLDLIRTQAISQFAEPSENDVWQVRIKKGQVVLKSKKTRARDARPIHVDFFPITEMMYDIERPPRLKKGFRHDTIYIPLSEYREEDPEVLEGILVEQFSTPEGLVTVNTHINKAILP